MSNRGASNLTNIVAVARREFMFRARTRTYRYTTILLMILGVGLALSPVIIRFIDRGGTGDRVEVIVGSSKPGVDVPSALGLLLNAPLSGTSPGTNPTPSYRVVAASNVDDARGHVVDGSSAAVLALDRSASGDLTFTLYSKDPIISRTSQLIQQAASSIAIQDRLGRAGLSPSEQASLFTPPAFARVQADPNSKQPGLDSTDAFIGSFAVSFVLAIVLFMAIILYGQWVAFSVAEEKNSRVMEIVLAAATPFQLLSGKVLGVGGLAMVQYLLVLGPAVVAILLQDRIASMVLGGATTVDLPKGLSIGILAVFGVMFVLGFALYAVLYAGAASLVSRQEDVNQIVAPLTIVSVAGYMVATYAGTGLIPLDSPLVVVMSYIPFFSPYLMLTRLSLGTAGPPEVLLSIVLLAASVPLALWVAARLYRSGVLMYGQRPTPRTLWRALRTD